MSSILRTIRSSFAPIRKEGIPFIAIGVFLTLFLGWLWTPLFWVLLILTGWCVYFFRDPVRVVPLSDDIVLSPADGRIASVGEVVPPRELGLGEAARVRVSVFMSVFDCHVNRAPAAGTVMRIAYRPGRFINAELDKASEDNERNGIVIETAHGALGVVQIAGLVARRILCWTREGDSVAAGGRIGMIRFGSRLDTYLPPGAHAAVEVGQVAVAGETVIARFGDAPAMQSRRD